MIITIFKKINDQCLHLSQDASLYVRAFMFCVGVLSLSLSLSLTLFPLSLHVPLYVSVFLCLCFFSFCLSPVHSISLCVCPSVSRCLQSPITLMPFIDSFVFESISVLEHFNLKSVCFAKRDEFTSLGPWVVGVGHGSGHPVEQNERPMET